MAFLKWKLRPLFRDIGDLQAARFSVALDAFMSESSCYFITPWYHPVTSMEDRAMLGSNLSAVAGDGDMEGGIQSNVL